MARMLTVTRRDVLGGAAAAAVTAGANPAPAAAPVAGKSTPGVYRYRIGEFELTALYDGIWYRPINKEFIRNAPFAEAEHALDAAFMPHDKLATPFTTLNRQEACTARHRHRRPDLTNRRYDCR
jgi:hypothetical protein